jgi:outer membrane protein assembly factor BamB
MGSAAVNNPQKAWEFHYPFDTQLGEPYKPHTEGGPDHLRSGFRFLTFPAVTEHAIYVQGPRDLAAIDPANGKVLWDQVYPVATEDELPEFKESFWRWAEGYPFDRPVQAAPVVSGNRVYARIAMSHQRLSREDFWPADMAIAAFDARDGSLLWRRQAGGSPAGQFWNLPTAGSDMVLTGSATFAAGLTESRAVALDAGSGEVLWSTFLGGGSHPLSGTDGSPAIVKDGEVWIESALHTLTALDLLTGDIRLVVKATVYTRGMGERIEEGPTPDWPVSLLAARGNRIFFSDRWSSEVLCLDPATGKPVWTAEKAADNRQAWNAELIGLDDRHLYVGGHFLQAIDLNTGQSAWTWKPKEFRPNAGYPILSGDHLLFPQEGKLYVVDAATGNELSSADLSDLIGGKATYCALAAAGDTLLATSGTRIVALRGR